ncbi:uncharacterized protein LOC106163036 [Lingula anatina]|uniref:Uncharacterized protein LOC106163036 n=1 Tax=Lingula anatina TaxID=7574 RepID=A0A1S3ICJ5_LINAN|nr:uncharacterized protein LOC106163036 [Lingula anatina]|eukprot:XP_013395962.1 uncharacterized protein LOC106163036 [Lingula anatina]
MDAFEDAVYFRPNASLKVPNSTDNSPLPPLTGVYRFDYLAKLVVICAGAFCSIFSAVIFRRPVMYKNIAAAYLLSVISISDSCYLISAFVLGLERLQCGIALPNGVCQAVLYASHVLRCLCTWLIVSLAFFSYMYISREGRAQKHFRSVHCKVVLAWQGLFAGMAFLHLTWMTGVETGMCFPFFGLYFSALVVMEKIETFIVVILPDVLLCVVCSLSFYICIRRSYFKATTTRQTYIPNASEIRPFHLQEGDREEAASQQQDRSPLSGEDAIFHLKIPVAVCSLHFVLSLPQHVIQIRIIVLQLMYGDFEYSPSTEENYLHDVFHVVSLTKFAMNCIMYSLLSATFRANVKALLLPSRCWRPFTTMTNAIETPSVADESVGTRTTVLAPEADNADTQSAVEDS